MNANVNWDRLDVGIEYQGRAITLPGDPAKMPLLKAKEALERKIADEEQSFRVHELIDAYPLDAAVAFVRAMQKLYGWASPQTEIQAGMMGIKKTPPTMISVKTGHRDDDVVQCPIGAFKLPGVDELVRTAIVDDAKGRKVFVIFAEIKKRDKHLLLELATETRRIVKEQSIYRGKAIRLGVDSDGDLDLDDPPAFLDVSVQDVLIFDDETQAQINHSVLSLIVHPKDAKALNVPFKRTVLFEGPYGTGKSLLAKEVARICEENGRTFILLDRVQGLKQALEFAERYSPAVVFAEDIDRIVEDRDEDANDLINIVDGVLSKRSQVMTILTTNYPDKLHPAMLRPGRIDDVISLRPPTDETVKRLLRVYAGDLLDDLADVSEAATELSGQIPAAIRECVERAKLGMIWRRDTRLADSDLVTAARTMKNHLALLNRKVVKETPAETLAKSLHDVVMNGRGEKIDLVPDVKRLAQQIYNNQ